MDKAYVEEITSKANKSLGLIKRVCHDVNDVKIRKLLYCLIVRPRLEYCSCVWSPYTVKHRVLIENVQRHATKFILNYLPGIVPYVDRLTSLDLLLLEYWWKIRDILFLYKLKLGTMSIDCNKFFNPVTSGYTTRNFDPNNFKINANHKQGYFRFSYFPQAVNLWNNLPKDYKICTTFVLLKTKLLHRYKSLLPSYKPP